MSCAIPIRIVNPHYKSLAKENNESVKKYESNDDYYLDVPCGQCANCLKSKGSSWALRLQLEYKYLTSLQKSNSFFVTLTLSEEHINKDKSLLIRLFLERIRKAYGRSIRHWIISEYGENTKRFHYHGLLFDIPFHRTELFKFWKYGHVTIQPITPRRITYITSYVNKHLKNNRIPLEDPRYKQSIWCSKGIGSSVALDERVTKHLRIGSSCTPFMHNPSGRVVTIPRYLREKFYNHVELSSLKDAYYANLSEDVIPDPPYFIGNKKYTDYTIYMLDCAKLRKQRTHINYKYGKR